MFNLYKQICKLMLTFEMCGAKKDQQVTKDNFGSVSVNMNIWTKLCVSEAICDETSASQGQRGQTDGSEERHRHLWALQLSLHPYLFITQLMSVITF